MQPTKFDKILENCSNNHNIHFQTLKRFSDFLFSETKEEVKKMDKLIINLPGFINYFFSKKRLLQLKDDFDRWERGDKTRVPLYFDRNDAEKIKDYSKRTDLLLEQYDMYLKKKKEIKEYNVSNI